MFIEMDENSLDALVSMLETHETNIKNIKHIKGVHDELEEIAKILTHLRNLDGPEQKWKKLKVERDRAMELAWRFAYTVKTQGVAVPEHMVQEALDYATKKEDQ